MKWTASAVTPMSAKEEWTKWVAAIRKSRQEGTKLDMNEWRRQVKMVRETLEAYNESQKQDTADSVARTRLGQEARLALRFAMLSLSIHEQRKALQDHGVLELALHCPLAALISLPNVDDRCRAPAAKLLCNLVTGNTDTSTRLSHDIALAPSSDAISARMMELVVDVPPPSEGITWVDTILATAKSGNREALGALIATLHNCLAALQPSTLFAAKVASTGLLISTLLRQIISAKSLTSVREAEASSEADHTDDATEWIYLVIERLCRLGLVGELCTSASGGSSSTHELVVLLYCVERAVAVESSSDDHPFGSSEPDLVKSHLCLAQRASDLRDELASSCTDATEASLSKAALVLIMEILASSLSNDSNPKMGSVRTTLAEDTSLLSEVAMDLGKMVDVVSEASRGRKKHEEIMTSEQQRWIVVLVRLLGNLCYKCKPNQDKMRQVEVSAISAPAEVRRTALHVLMSATSLSFGCFTLREWAILAIRNVLEENNENQALVAELQAQQPQPSADLESMGVKVEMNKNGQVKVLPK